MAKFKKVATLCLALLMGCAVGMFATACNDDEVSSTPTNSEQTEVTDAYKFVVVYEDGTPAVGMQVQICKGTEVCLAPVATDAQGVSVVKTTFGEFAYDIHILNLPTGYTFNPEKTPATYGEVKITLKAA